MGWIAGWNKRIKLTISGSCIEGDLSNFPVMVHLGSTCSGVFNELGSNSKRISVVNSEQSQCYVEVERWDETTKNAWLWVNSPTLSSGVDSDLYLYYDNLHPDNSVYIGTVGETSAQNVWDDNFVGVWHMNQDPSGGSDCIKDSTGNSNDGTPGGSMTSEDLVDGKVGKALDFDGSGDVINCGSDSLLDNIDQLTFESIVNFDSYGSTYGRFFVKNRRFYLNQVSHCLRFDQFFSTQLGRWDTPNDSVTTDTDYGICVTYDRTSLSNDAAIYINANSQNITESQEPLGTVTSDVSDDLYLGNNSGATGSFDGRMDEVRISNILRPAAWIKATYYSNWDQLINYGAEETVSSGILAGWENRLKLTIQNDYIDNTLTDFPVMIKLSGDSGYNSFDNRSVFYELEANINRKKIAITDSTGILQCFVEIERFSCAETEAVLWTKLPVIYADVGTHFYLYYDKTKADNNLFVGDVNSIVAQNVWDNNFIGVWHMNQDPSGGAGCIKDSTGNSNDGTPAGMISGDLVDGKIGKALDFDGGNTLINVGSASTLDNIDQKTLEVIITPDTFGGNNSGRLLDKSKFSCYLSQTTSTLKYLHNFSIAAGAWAIPNNSISTGTIYNLVVTYDRTSISNDPKMYLNATSQTITETLTPDGAANSDVTDNLYIANRSDAARAFDGIIDEVRVSNIIRSTPWIKATHHSNWDSLIIFEKESVTTSWLDDWSKRIKLTIDHTKIDSSLIDFPVLVTLASGVQGDFFSEMYLSEGITWYDHQLVINKNSEGTYDTTDANVPCVIKDGDTYKIWYSGNDGSNFRILYATSTDGITWSNHQMVIDYNVEGVYDTVHARYPSVIKDGSIYKMWYAGNDGGNDRILYATSTNGTTWSGHQMVLNIGSEGTYDTTHAYYPNVIKDGDTYKMWYGGFDGTNVRILYAISTNGTTWSNHQLVIDIGSEGTYDTAQAFNTSVIKDGDIYKVWYGGNDGSNCRILYATSTNGTVWSNHQMVININVEGTYDTVRAFAPSVIKDGDTYKIWYSGNDGSNFRILYAYSDDSYSNRKKIAATKNNGTTQILIEIEQFDSINGIVNLWTKIPTIVFDIDTDIYLYYDNTKADNTDYVGDVGSASARNVWDSNFVGVWHTNQDPSIGGACIKDSTSNANHGTPAGSMTSGDLVDGKVGKALDFDGSDDYIGTADLALTTAATISLCFKPNVTFDSGASVDEFLLSKWTSAMASYYLKLESDNGKAVVAFRTATDNNDVFSTTTSWSNFNQITSSYDNGVSKIYANGFLENTINGTAGSLVDSAGTLKIGALVDDTPRLWFGGIVDEVRISNTARSASWIKATYYSNWNILLTQGSYQNYTPPPDYYYHGYVKEKGVYVARKLYLYRRDTGLLMDSGMSNISTGYYLLETSVSGEHFIVVLDDDAGDTYNALVQDRLYPNDM